MILQVYPYPRLDPSRIINTIAGGKCRNILSNLSKPDHGVAFSKLRVVKNLTCSLNDVFSFFARRHEECGFSCHMFRCTEMWLGPENVVRPQSSKRFFARCRLPGTCRHNARVSCENDFGVRPLVSEASMQLETLRIAAWTILGSCNSDISGILPRWITSKPAIRIQRNSVSIHII